MKTKAEIFEELKQLLVEQAGVRPDQIAMDTSLLMDLNVWGDDGDEVFQALEDKFEVEWSGIDLGAMFGSEYAPRFAPEQGLVQPCTVGDLVRSIQAKKWVGEAPRPWTDEELVWRRAYRRNRGFFFIALIVVFCLIGFWFDL